MWDVPHKIFKVIYSVLIFILNQHKVYLYIGKIIYFRFHYPQAEKSSNLV